MEDSVKPRKVFNVIEPCESLSNKDGKKDFPMFKPSVVVPPQSKTIDHSESKKVSKTTSSIRSISPTSNTIKSRAGTILRTRTEETTLNSLHNNSAGGQANLTGSKSRGNKSNSNERSKSKKKGCPKDKMYPRPKTSKSTRKEKQVDEKKIDKLNAQINSLLSSNSTGLAGAFQSGFFDRPSSVIEDSKWAKVPKFNDKRDRSNKSNKNKGAKSTRGGTPAPTFQGRQQQANTV